MRCNTKACTNEHQHKCGFNMIEPGLFDVLQGVNPPSKRGCGHVWTCTHITHHCPECGEGPWLWKYDPETVERAKIMNPEGL